MKILKLMKYAPYFELFQRLGAAILNAVGTGLFRDTEPISIKGQKKYLTVILSDTPPVS